MCLDDSNISKSCNEYKTIRKALEKQIPKKARQNSLIASGIFHKTYFHTCPTCGNMLLTKMMNERQETSFCWDCGQKLDWREGEQK